MRMIKMLGLTIMALAIAVALFRSAPVSAGVKRVVPCQVNQTLCATANLWPTVAQDQTAVVLSHRARFLSGIAPLTCESEARLLAEKNLELSIAGKMTSLTWASCTTCPTVTTTTLPSWKILDLEGVKAHLVTTSETVVSLKGCPFGAECTIKFPTGSSLEFSGGSIGGTAQFVANEIPVSVEGGFLCGSGSAKFDADSGQSSPYVVTSVNYTPTGSLFFSSESHA